MADYASVLDKQRTFFNSGATLDVEFRIRALRDLKAAIEQNEEKILSALHSDLGKCAAEAYATEIGLVYSEIGDALKHIRRWSRPRRALTPAMHFLSWSRIVPEPHGIALIMSPWNYPFQLTLVPLVSALAAGNCAVVKPSAYSPATSAVIAGILRQCFSECCVAVFEGGRKANEALLRQRFDIIFFTGSPAVGRYVMECASKNLTPVTLELGGKSPCIVCADANIPLAAKRIAWGKTVNAGQTCVAPDYVLAHKSVAEPLAREIGACIEGFFGKAPCACAEYPRIVNEKHFERVSALIFSGRVVSGGRADRETLRIEPTVLMDVAPDSPVMQEEIFGPVLPVLTYENLDEAISFIRSRPKPLALYLFTANKETERRIMGSVAFGGGCVNDTLVHTATSHIPFGGVGESGMGGYHGKWGFDTFTHYKSVLRKSTRLDMAMRYPPYGEKLKLFRRVMK